MSASKKMRCAIYTRTSSDENLDQEFNSLNAQREACEAFISSQSGEGWHLLKDNYEDGGYSGGSLERPALTRLLKEVREDRIDVVVVYKIDRLTRSLMGFSKIVESFDKHNVSFVSVTQAFNTTSSMGRLTLNVLLSFAQFEREVTAERIRDKFAASKKKGMWMGGNVPLGYRVENRKLLICKTEAETIRLIFKRYLELKSIRILAAELNESDVVIRRGKPRSNGKYISAVFRAGNLRNILANPIYIGNIRHKEKIYAGLHSGIIDVEQFEQVQSQLKLKAPKRKGPSNSKDAHLLTGILFDETGDRLTPIHCNNHGKRYRYYVSRRLTTGESENGNPTEGWRIPATQLEPLVEKQLLDILRNKSQLLDWFSFSINDAEIPQLASSANSKIEEWEELVSNIKRRTIQNVFPKIIIKPGWITYEMDRAFLYHWLMDAKLNSSNAEQSIKIDLPMMIRRKGVESKMVITNGTAVEANMNPALIDMIVRANRYRYCITNGSNEDTKNIIKDDPEISRLLPLAFLSPSIVDAILNGTQPVELGARRLARMSNLPAAWEDQAELLGFNA